MMIPGKNQPGQLRLAALLMCSLFLTFPSLGQTQIDATPIPIPQFCINVAQPFPSGVTQRPNNDINTFADYHWITAATHLQGNASKEKYAPCLYYEPQDAFYSFRSVMVVNNPSPSVATTITIQYYTPAGVALFPASTFTLAPEATRVELASILTPFGGYGSARITGTEPFVGGTIHHTYELAGCTEPDHASNPGMTSFQQFQENDLKNELYWGPLPATNMASTTGFANDFLNGNTPIFCIKNPNDTPANVTITYVDRLGAAPAPTNVVIPPNGNFTDYTIASLVFNVYATTTNFFDDDFGVIVKSDVPVLGEGVMIDIFGDSGPYYLNPCERFRMGSTMMPNKKSSVLVSPEFNYQTPASGNAPITSYMGIMNVNSRDIGPVTVRYYNRNGAQIAVDTIASMPFGALHRIAPGSASTPNYPSAVDTFDGWVRIIACKSGMVGWTMKETRVGNDPGGWFYHKVWGETLDGTNKSEPGTGIPIVNASGNPMFRMVAPILQTDPSWYWPGYEAILNDTTSNIGAYEYNFFNFNGANTTVANSWAGLQYGDTSFTYQDPFTWYFGTQSGRVDHTAGSIKGIDALGDPLWEYTWGGQIEFPFGPPEPPNPLPPPFDPDYLP